MLFKTIIDSVTVQAYHETQYFVQGNKNFTLEIGRINSNLLATHFYYGVECSAFITACNPQSQIISDAENARRQLGLTTKLTKLGLTYLNGIGKHPSNHWPGEESYLVLGVDIDTAKMLGKDFDQNAIVWCSVDGIPELVLLK